MKYKKAKHDKNVICLYYLLVLYRNFLLILSANPKAFLYKLVKLSYFSLLMVVYTGSESKVIRLRPHSQ